jgi:hypothetical protein
MYNPLNSLRVFNEMSVYERGFLRTLNKFSFNGSSGGGGGGSGGSGGSGGGGSSSCNGRIIGTMPSE